jgi:methyl-accepting chemotaxis protein
MTSISVRLLRTVFGCYLFLAIFVTGTQLWVEFNNTKKEIENDLTHLASVFGPGISEALWTFNDKYLNSLILGMSHLSFVAGGEIVDMTNVLSTSFGDDLQEAKKMLLAAKESEGLAEVGDNTSEFFGASIKLMHQAKNGTVSHVGNLFVYSSRSLVFERVKPQFILIVISAIIKTAALWVIFLYFSQRILAKPLQKLANSMSNVNLANLGSFKLDVVPKHQDELFELQESFNFMARNLHNSLLTQKHTEKERQVVQNYIDLAPVIMVVLDQAGRVELINDRGCEILGFPREKVINCPSLRSSAQS